MCWKSAKTGPGNNRPGRLRNWYWECWGGEIRRDAINQPRPSSGAVEVLDPVDQEMESAPVPTRLSSTRPMTRQPYIVRSPVLREWPIPVHTDGSVTPLPGYRSDALASTLDTHTAPIPLPAPLRRGAGVCRSSWVVRPFACSATISRYAFSRFRITEHHRHGGSFMIVSQCTIISVLQAYLRRPRARLWRSSE
jgi:hypothetical protein